MSDEAARRAWVAPPATGTFAGLELRYLDPADEDDRDVLIRAEHPELERALENDEDEIELNGQVMSPRLHLTLHAVVANQIWADDPKEMWLTAQRLTAAGYDRHEVLHMLAQPVSDDMYEAVVNQRPFDIDRTRRALDALPESWEALREPPPRNRAERRAHAKRRKH